MDLQKCNDKKLDHNDGYEYEETCSNCSEVIHVYTQQDNDPEYHTNVGVKCKCGLVVWFILPVN